MPLMGGFESVWADVLWVGRTFWLEIGESDVGDVILNSPVCDILVVVLTAEPIRA